MKIAQRASLLAVAVAALACNTPKEAHDGSAVPTAAPVPIPSAAPAPAPAPASASAPASAPAPASKCTSDADCRTWSSYCSEAPCACRVLATSEPDPKCLGPTKVRCFADPCLRKVASCQSGACVLTAK